MELVDKLKCLCSRVFDERFIYIWGNRGTGKVTYYQPCGSCQMRMEFPPFFLEKIKKSKNTAAGVAPSCYLLMMCTYDLIMTNILFLIGIMSSKQTTEP